MLIAIYRTWKALQGRLELLDTLCTALETRIRDLERERETFLLDRNHLISTLTALEARVRATVRRAEPKEPPADNGHLDRALIDWKGRR